jgi:hypothetical protein
MLAKSYDKHIGRPFGNGVIITGVERKGTSLIYRVQVPSHPNGVEGFVNWVTSRRQKSIRAYCGSDDWATYSRNIGLTQVWVYRYADTDRVETISQSPEQCTR